MRILDQIADMLNNSGLIVGKAYEPVRPFGPSQIEAKLPNGARLSVIAGGGAYADGDTVEIAFLSADRSNGLFDARFSDEWNDDVLGYQTPEEVMEWVRRYVSESEGQHAKDTE